ncbi:tetraspanin-1-like [Zerene cesonia]|uniref:tetraspanin-1-like n=1 Tax=Zerene cesonia TaxID=33412 RepID=UPI0018E50C38|nr:tetraspanin-1-like [Zerene cesonia]
MNTIKGLILLIIGITYLVKHRAYEDLLTNRFFTLPAFVIATGCIIFLIAALGFYGAFSEHFYAVAAYAVFMLAILIFEMSITIVAFGLRKDAVAEIRTPMAQSLNLYESRREIARLWDDMQMSYECCGAAGRHDFASNRIPVSCCHIDYGTVSPFTCNLTNAHVTGCAIALGGSLSNNAYVIGIIGALFTCIQAILTAMSGWLAWRSKFEEVELES